MGTKRGKEEGSFVRETRRQAIDSYRDLVQDLRPWQASAPKLPPKKPEEPEAVTPQPEPPPFSDAASREPARAKRSPARSLVRPWRAASRGAA